LFDRNARAAVDLRSTVEIASCETGLLLAQAGWRNDGPGQGCGERGRRRTQGRVGRPVMGRCHGPRAGLLPWAGASVRATVAAGPSRGEWAGWAGVKRITVH
jgi:hypothetical protein